MKQFAQQAPELCFCCFGPNITYLVQTKKYKADFRPNFIEKIIFNHKIDDTDAHSNVLGYDAGNAK